MLQKSSEFRLRTIRSASLCQSLKSQPPVLFLAILFPNSSFLNLIKPGWYGLFWNLNLDLCRSWITGSTFCTQRQMGM